MFIMILLIGCKSKSTESSLPFINKPDFTPEWIAENDEAYKNIHRIPEKPHNAHNPQRSTSSLWR